jgi:hypothetical protein
MSQRALRGATWFISRLAPENERESLVGDLMEEHALRAQTMSSSDALWWYLKQVCASAPSLLRVRAARGAWISTLGVALLAYVAVGVAEFSVNWAVSRAATSASFTYEPMALAIMFPVVMLIGHIASRFRRGSASVLGVMMLLVVTAMMLWSTEAMPLWFRIAYFFVGPAAAFIGGHFRSWRKVGS